MITLRLKIADKEVELTLEEAKRLYNELHTLVGSDDIPRYISTIIKEQDIPVYIPIPSNPFPYQPYEITCAIRTSEDLYYK